MLLPAGIPSTAFETGCSDAARTSARFSTRSARVSGRSTPRSRHSMSIRTWRLCLGGRPPKWPMRRCCRSFPPASTSDKRECFEAPVEGAERRTEIPFLHKDGSLVSTIVSATSFPAGEKGRRLHLFCDRHHQSPEHRRCAAPQRGLLPRADDRGSGPHLRGQPRRSRRGRSTRRPRSSCARRPIVSSAGCALRSFRHRLPNARPRTFARCSPRVSRVALKAGRTTLDREVWLSTWLAPIPDEDGNVTAVLGLSRHMTARKRAEDELRAAEQRLRVVMSNLPLVLWASNRDGVATFCAGQALQAVGVTPQEVVGQRFKEYRVRAVQRSRRARAARAGGRRSAATSKCRN